jgi:hypothetical protein
VKILHWYKRRRLTLEFRLLVLLGPQKKPLSWFKVGAEELLMQFLPWELMLKVVRVEVIIKILPLLQEQQKSLLVALMGVASSITKVVGLLP